MPERDASKCTRLKPVATDQLDNRHSVGTSPSAALKGTLNMSDLTAAVEHTKRYEEGSAGQNDTPDERGMNESTRSGRGVHGEYG